MKKAFIVYFEDHSGLVVISEDIHTAVSSLSSEQQEKVYRVDLIPHPVL